MLSECGGISQKNFFEKSFEKDLTNEKICDIIKYVAEWWQCELRMLKNVLICTEES